MFLFVAYEAKVAAQEAAAAALAVAASNAPTQNPLPSLSSSTRSSSSAALVPASGSSRTTASTAAAAAADTTGGNGSYSANAQLQERIAADRAKMERYVRGGGGNVCVDFVTCIATMSCAYALIRAVIL